MRVWLLSSLPPWKKTPEAWSGVAAGGMYVCLPPASGSCALPSVSVALCLSPTYSCCFVLVMSVPLQCPGSLCPSWLWVLPEGLPLLFRLSHLLLPPHPPSVLCCLLLHTSSRCCRTQAAHLFFICTPSSPCIILGHSVCGDQNTCNQPRCHACPWLTLCLQESVFKMSEVSEQTLLLSHCPHRD